MPEISIIVPVYKAEKYLRQCIDSILAQTFSDFELILVDDGSPDDSGAICDTYSEKDNRIKVIHQANAGVSAARNAALDIARGKYIMFCDSDDWVEPDWCKCMYEAIQTPNVVMAICNNNEWNDEVLRNTYIAKVSNPHIKLSELFANPLPGAPWDKIFIKQQIEDYNLRFPIEISFGEDIRFIFDYLSTFDEKKQVKYISSVLYNYRMSENGLSGGHIKDFWDLEKDLLELRLRLANKHNTNLELYQEKLNNHYFNLVFRSMYNIFDTKNNLSLYQKYKEFKRIVCSEEFELMKKSKAYGNPPWWYRTLVNHRVLPLLYIYHSHKRNYLTQT